MFVLTVIAVTATVTMKLNACPETSFGNVFCIGKGLTAIPPDLSENAVHV